MWNSIQNLIPKIAGKYKISRTLKAIEICREYRRIAPHLLPGESLLFTDAKSYETGTLTLTAANSAWADQIHRNKHKITEAMNARFGEGIIKKVNIRIAPKTEDEAWLHSKTGLAS
jgi:hypothetical protein